MGQKVSFDEINKIINITVAPDANGDINIDVKEDLYSDGKEDWVANENLRRFQFPITAVGGNPLPGGAALGTTFFLASDWKIRPYDANHRLTIDGNLYATDGSDPFLNTIGNYTVRIMQKVSSLVDGVQDTSIAGAVWDSKLEDYTGEGTTGKKLGNDLTIQDYLGLQ